MARNINDLSGLYPAQNFDQGGRAPFPRRIEHNRRLARLKFSEERGKQVLGLAGDELAIWAAFLDGVLPRRFDRQGIQFHSHKPLNQVSGLEAEKSHAAIDIHEETRAAFLQTLAHNLHQFRKQKKIVLKE